MRDSLYDAWLTREPDLGSEPSLPGDPDYPRCGRCGAFLKLKPDAVTAHEHEGQCTGLHAEHWAYKLGYDAECGETQIHLPHGFIANAWSIKHRACMKCLNDNEEVDA